MIQFLHSLKNAVRGLAYVIRNEANMRWHLLAALIVVSLGLFFQIERWEWAAIVICIGSVLALESFNTAVEKLADRITDEQDPLIGTAKDVAAGAVLVMSGATATVGCIVFLHRILALLPVS